VKTRAPAWPPSQCWQYLSIISQTLLQNVIHIQGFTIFALSVEHERLRTRPPPHHIAQRGASDVVAEPDDAYKSCCWTQGGKQRFDAL